MSTDSAVRIAVTELYRELPARTEAEIAASVALDVSAALKPILTGRAYRVGIVRQGNRWRAVLAVQGADSLSGDSIHAVTMAAMRVPAVSMLRWTPYR